MKKKEGMVVEVVHPWPEWIELMERLVGQNYFDHRRKGEDRMVKELGLDALETVTVEDEDLGIWGLILRISRRCTRRASISGRTSSIF